MAKRDLISVIDMQDKWAEMVDLAIKLKAERGHHGDPLKGKTLAMIFEKPSTRTRISFDVAITELGGHALYIDESKMQMGVHSETVEDTARVMSRFVHGIMYRAFDYKMMDKFGEYATVPVISGLDNLEHPCQALADMVTIKEKLGGFRGKKLVYLGDGNNVCNSLLYACAIMGIDMAGPPSGCPTRRSCGRHRRSQRRTDPRSSHPTSPRRHASMRMSCTPTPGSPWEIQHPSRMPSRCSRHTRSTTSSCPSPSPRAS